MSPPQHCCPSPRAAVGDPALVRPERAGGEPRDPARLWLDKNESGDPEMRALLARVLADIPPGTLGVYPELAPLYRKLADHLEVSPGNLLLAAGSDGVIRSVFEAFVAPGDVVIHTQPTFAMYAVYCRMYGATVRTLGYRPTNDVPRLNAADFIGAIAEARPKLICLPNPDSPTGTAFAPGEIRTIVEAAGEAGAVMLIDEAYYPFHAETCLPWIGDFPHLIVARSTGKAWGMAGLRIGYAVAETDLTNVLHKVRPMYETSTLAAAVFERMLDHADAMRESVARLNAGKAAFLDAMEGLGLRTLRGHGNFLHVAFGVHAEAVHAALGEIVYYRREFSDPCLEGFSRFTATTPALFQPVIECIAEVVGKE